MPPSPTRKGVEDQAAPGADELGEPAHEADRLEAGVRVWLAPGRVQVALAHIAFSAADCFREVGREIPGGSSKPSWSPFRTPQH